MWTSPRTVCAGACRLQAGRRQAICMSSLTCVRMYVCRIDESVDDTPYWRWALFGWTSVLFEASCRNNGDTSVNRWTCLPRCWATLDVQQSLSACEFPIQYSCHFGTGAKKKCWSKGALVPDFAHTVDYGQNRMAYSGYHLMIFRERISHIWKKKDPNRTVYLQRTSTRSSPALEYPKVWMAFKLSLPACSPCMVSKDLLFPPLALVLSLQVDSLKAFSKPNFPESLCFQDQANIATGK